MAAPTIRRTTKLSTTATGSWPRLGRQTHPSNVAAAPASAQLGRVWNSAGMSRRSCDALAATDHRRRSAARKLISVAR